MQKNTSPTLIPAWQAKLQRSLTVDRMAVATALGVTERTIYNWSIGKGSPRLRDLAWLEDWAA